MNFFREDFLLEHQSKKQLELKFCWFQRFGVNFTRGSHRKCSIKKGNLENFAIFAGKRLCQSLFLSCNFIKKEIGDLAQGISRDFCRVFKNTFFTEHLWMPSSILVAGFVFVIMYSWQLSTSEKTLVEEKNSYICLKNFTDLEFLYTDIYLFIFFDNCLLFTLSFTQSVCCTLSSQPIWWFGDTCTPCFWPILKIWIPFPKFSKKHTVS